MSEEFAFLDEWISELPSQTYASKFPLNEAVNHVDSSRKPNHKSELEEKLRKENARLRCYYKHYRKTLNEREARLTELLKEKLSMTEEKERIEDWKKKIEEANVHKEATEQLNKQLHELAKTFERDKITLGDKIQTLQKKARKLKKELNGRDQQVLQERKRRLKLLKIIIELSEILISVGLLPVKYKRSLDGWKFEVNLNEDEADGDDDVGEKNEGEVPKDGKSPSKSIAQVPASKTMVPPQAVVLGSKEETSLAVMSDSDSSGDEGSKASSPPARNPPSSARPVDSLKTLYKELVTSKEDILRVGNDFGSTVMSPCSSVSVGEQCGAGSSSVGKGPSRSPVLSPSTSIGYKSVNSESGRTEKSVILSSEEDNWHWDEFSQDLNPAVSSGISGTDKEIRSVSVEKKQKQLKKSQVALEKSCDSTDSSDIGVILGRMHFKLPSLLEPFEMEYDAPHSSSGLISNDWPCKNTPEKLAVGTASCDLDSGTIERGMDDSSAQPSATVSSLPLTINNRLSSDRIVCENVENNKGMSSVVNEVGAAITADAVESLNPAIASPQRDLSRSKKKRRRSKKSALTVVDSNFSAESCDDVQHTKKGEVNEMDKVSRDLSTTLSTIEEERGSEIEDKVNPVGERSQRGKSLKFSGQEQDGNDKSKDEKHPEKDVEENAITIKSPAHRKLSPFKEEGPTRFSLRLRSNKPVTERICPKVVNNNVEVPSEADSVSSPDNSPGGKLPKTKAKRQKAKKTLPLVDYSDTSDTCDSVLPTVRDVEDNVSVESVNIMENMAVDTQGPAESKLMPMQKENDSMAQLRAQKEMNVLCNSNGDITHIAEHRGIIPIAEESSKSVLKCGKLKLQMDVGDSSISGDVVSLPTVEKSPTPIAPSECHSVKENDTSMSQLVNSLNSDSMLAADSAEEGGKSCHFEKDHGSERSETESSATYSIFNPSDELFQDGDLVSGLDSPFSFSSDESGDEFSDALSALDDDDASSVSVHGDARENGVKMSRDDLGKCKGTVPSLCDSISSRGKSSEKGNPSVSVTNDSRSLPNKQEESVVPMRVAPNSRIPKGVVLPKEGTRNEIRDERSLIDNNSNASKNIICDPKEVLNNSILSEGNRTTESVNSLKAQTPLQNPTTVPLINSVSSDSLKEVNHSLDGTSHSALTPDKAKGKTKKNSRLLSDDKKTMILTKTSTPSLMGEGSSDKHVENPVKADSSPKGFNRGKNDIKNSPAPSKEPAGRKSMLSFGTGPLRKIISFLGENSSRKIAVPFLFKKLNLFQFPGVKFSLHGRLASEFFPDPYSFPKHPLLSFGGCDLEEFYQMLRAMADDQKSEELQHVDIKFYKQGSFAPSHYIDLYLNPARLAVNFGHERRKTLKSHKEEDSHLKEAEGNSTLSANCLPGQDLVDTIEVVDSDSSNTLCNDSENGYDSTGETPVADHVLVAPGDFDNDCMVIDKVSSCAPAKNLETSIQNVQVSPREKLIADSGSHSDCSGRLQTNHLSENASSRLHTRDQTPDHSLALSSPVTRQETSSCVGASVMLRDLTFNGGSASNVEPEERITDKKSLTEGYERGEKVNNQEVENDGVIMSSRISSHKPQDSIFIETNSRDSYSSGGYSSDKEDSPSGSVVDGAVYPIGKFGEKSLKESFNTNIRPNTSTEIGLSKPSSSLNSAEEVTLRNTSQNDISAVSDTQHIRDFTGKNRSKADLRMADDGRKSHLTGAGLGLLGENNHHITATQPSKDQCRDSSNEMALRNKEESVSCKSSALPDSFTLNRLKGQTTENEDHAIKLVRAKCVEKIDDGSLAGNVGIDDIIMVISPDGRIPDETLINDSSNAVEIFSKNDGKLQVNLPLDVTPFLAKLGEEKRNVSTILTHETGNESKEPCEEKVEEVAGPQIVDGIVNNSFSDEPGYSSMPKSALSGPDSDETAQIPSSQMPFFNSREKAAEAVHIDKCLMAENLDDLIELAGGLPSFDDGCLGADPSEVSELVAKANVYAPSVEGDGGAHDSSQTSDIRSRPDLQELACHSGPDSSSSVSDQGQSHSAENCSVQTHVSRVCDKNSHDSTEFAVAVNEHTCGTLVKNQSSGREVKNLVVESGDSVAGDGGGQSKDVRVENFDVSNGSGPVKSPCSQSVCVEKRHLSVQQTNSATNSRLAVEIVDDNELDLNGSALHTEPATQGIAAAEMVAVELKVLRRGEVDQKSDKADSTPSAGYAPRDSIQVMKLPVENEKSSNLALSPGKERGSERTQLPDQMKNVKMEDVIKVDSTKVQATPISPDCGSVSLEEPESLTSFETLSMEKKNMVTKVAKKALFGTDSGDSSSDSESLSNLPTRKRSKRKINVILSSESGNECEKRRKVTKNEVQQRPTKRRTIQTRRGKSVRSKCNDIFGSPVKQIDSDESPSENDGSICQSRLRGRSKYKDIFGSPLKQNDSEESPSENDGSICQSRLRGVKNEHRSGGNHEETGRNSDKVGETNDGPHEVGTGSSIGNANVDNQPFLTDMMVRDGIQSEDNGQLMPSVNEMCKKHLAVQHVPSRPGAAPRTGTLLRRACAPKISNLPQKRPVTTQVTPAKAEEKEITLPDISTDAKLVQIDDVLNAAAIPSSRGEGKTILKVDEKKILPQGVEKSSESPGRMRKQSFANALKIDDAVILGVEDLKAMMEEPRRPGKIKTPQTKNKPDTTVITDEKGNAEVEKVCGNGKGNESSKQCISSMLLISVAEGDSTCIDNNMLELQNASKAAVVPDLMAVSPRVRRERAAKYGKKYAESEDDDSGKDSSSCEDVKLKPTSAVKDDLIPAHNNASISHSGNKFVETNGRSSEEDGDQTLLNEQDPLEAVAVGMCKGNIRRGAKAKKKISLSIGSNAEDCVKDTSIPEGREHHQTSEKFISNDPKMMPPSAQDGGPSVNDTLSNLCSNENSDEVEAGSGEEPDVYSSKKGARRISRGSGKGRKMPMAICNPKITPSKEEVDGGDTKLSEESIGVQPKKRVAHVPKTPPAMAKISPPSVNKGLATSKSEEKNGDEHENNEYNLTCRKKNYPSKVSTKRAKIGKDQGNECVPKTPSNENKNEDMGNSAEEQSSLPPKKRISNFPGKCAGVTKPSNISPSSKIISEEMDIDRNTAVEDRDVFEPQRKKRVAHALTTTSQNNDLNAHPPVNKSLSDTGINRSEKETVDGPEQGYMPPSKKRIAHVPKGPAVEKPSHSSSLDKNSSVSAEESIDKKSSPVKGEPNCNLLAKKRIAHTPKAPPKTSEADSFDSSLSETESLTALPSNQSCSTKISASKVRKEQKTTRPKAKMSKLSKLRTMVSRVRGYCPPSGPSDASTSRVLVHRGGGCCSRKNLPCHGNEDCTKKASNNSEQPTRRSLRKKMEECEPSPKKRRTRSETVEAPQPAKLKADNQLKAVSPVGSLPGLDEAVVTLESPQKESKIVGKPKSPGHVLETPLVSSPLKGEVNSTSVKKDALSFGALQEKMLEEMEVPPLSPLSDDAFVDALIEFPDSSESVSDVEIDQTPEFHSTPKSDPKRVFEVKCQLDSGKEVPVSDGVEGKQDDTKVLAIKSTTEVSSELMDCTGDTIECPKMVAKDYAPLLRGVHISFDAEDSMIGEYQVIPAESSGVSPSQMDATSVVDQSNADSHGSTLTPSRLREKFLANEKETTSYNWHNSTDYFSTMLTMIQKEKPAKEDSMMEFPYVSRDKRRILKAQLKKMNGQVLVKNHMRDILATLSDPKNGFQTKHIAKYLVRMLSKEDEDDVQSPVLSGAPRMTRFQMRALSLILALENRYPQFKDLSSLIFRGIQFILFRLGHCPEVEVVKTLARMYTALCMAKRDIWGVRCFIFDALFAIRKKAAPLISVVLSMWHEALPRQESGREPSHLESSFYMAIAHFEEMHLPQDLLQCIKSLKLIIRNVYHSEYHKKTFDQFMEELLSAMRGGKNVSTLVPAMVLVAKRQGWEWTHKNLLCKNLASIMANWKGEKPSRTAAVLAIKLIGLLCRSCPIETSGPVKNITEALSHMLVKDSCDDPCIKEALVVSLICLARYNTYHVVRAIDLWRPLRQPPEEVVKAIRGFVLRDSMQEFWRNKYRNWQKGVKNRKSHPHFKHSTPMEGDKVPLEENAAGECSRKEGNAEVNNAGRKRLPPKGDRRKFEVWLEDKTNAESIKEEVKEWDKLAFRKSNRKRKKNNKPKVSQT